MSELLKFFREVFRPLSTLEQLAANFPHASNCPKNGTLDTVQEIVSNVGGLNAMNSGSTTQWVLKCSACHTRERFRGI